MVTDRSTATLTAVMMMMGAAALLSTTTAATTTPAVTETTLGPSGLTDEMRTHIVTQHNTYRMMLRATNMLAMRWDSQLELKAAELVGRCLFQHSTNPTWGENIYRSEFNRPRKEIIATGLGSWNLEKVFAMGPDPCCDAIKNASLCCNYQQMIWAPTRMVGCALALCPKLVSPDEVYNNAYFLACFYNPSGNVAGFQPYGKGVPCSECPWTYDVCNKSLCYPSPNCTNPNI